MYFWNFLNSCTLKLFWIPGKPSQLTIVHQIGVPIDPKMAGHSSDPESLEPLFDPQIWTILSSHPILLSDSWATANWRIYAYSESLMIRILQSEWRMTEYGP